VLPFATEEVWSWWREGSVHRQPWPDAAALRPDGELDGVVASSLERAAAVLAEVRKAKSSAKTSQRTPVLRLVVTGPADAYAPVEEDLRNAAVVEGEIEYVEAGDGLAAVELGEAPAKVRT
jgi:valyl-tRNA synthetase